MQNIVYLGICSGCLGHAKQDALGVVQNALLRAALADIVKLKTPECYNACGRPATLTLQSQGRATYVFRDVEVKRDLEDIIATVVAYIAAPLGWIEDARVCGHLRHCLVARLPAIVG